MVLDIKECNEWQFLCKEGVQTLPWYVRPSLNVLEGIDLSDKIVWEYGGGLSTVYYAKHAKEVYTVDWNTEWVENIKDTLAHHNLKATVYNSQDLIEYVNMIDKAPKPDIIVIDGSERDNCFFKALEIMNDGDLMIFDNFMQPEVEMQCQEVQDEVKKHKHEIHKQEGHPYWQTLLLWK